MAGNLALRGWAWFASPLAYMTIAFGYFRSVWQDPNGLLIGGGSDPKQTMWTLGWPLHALATGQNPWLTDYLDHPDGVNLMWTPTPLAPSLLVAPVLVAWGPLVAYNLLMTLGPALSAWAASAAIHRLVPNRGAAFLGGLLYGFSPYVLAQELGHLGFVMAWTPPLVLLLLHELLVRRRWPVMPTGALLGLVMGLQLYTSSELLATTALVTLLGLATLLGVATMQERLPVQPALSALVRGGGAAAVVGLALGAPGLSTMFFGPQVVHGLIQPRDTFVTDLANLVLPDPLQLVAPEPLASLTARFTGLEVEWDGYVGVPLLLLLGITAVRWRDRPAVRWASILAGVVVVLSFGPHLHVLGRVIDQVPLPWWLLDRTLLAQALPSRLMVYFYLVAGILLAQFVRGAIVDARARVVRAPAVALVCLSLLLLAPMAKPWVTARTDPPFFSGPAVRRVPAGSVALVVPWAAPGDATAMNWQAASGYRYRMPEGYALHPGPGGEVAFAPPASPTSETLQGIELGRGVARSEALRAAMACDLARWRVRTVVVGPMTHEDEAVATMSWVIGRAPEDADGVHVWWDVAPPCEPHVGSNARISRAPRSGGGPG